MAVQATRFRQEIVFQRLGRAWPASTDELRVPGSFPELETSLVWDRKRGQQDKPAPWSPRQRVRSAACMRNAVDLRAPEGRGSLQWHSTFDQCTSHAHRPSITHVQLCKRGLRCLQRLPPCETVLRSALQLWSSRR